MESRVSFKQAFVLFWKNYIKFRGCASRREFWFWILWYAIIALPLSIIAIIGIACMFASNDESILNIGVLMLLIVGLIWMVFSLATLIPMLSLQVRRFHDTGRSMTIPIVYFVISNVFALFSNIVPDDFYASPVLTIVFVLMFLATITLFITIVVVACLKSKVQDNRYKVNEKMS